MSVNYNVRRVGPALLAALHGEPSLTSALCDSSVDFDPAEYERGFLAAVPAERVEAARASYAVRLRRMHAAQDEALAPLLAAGLSRSDLGGALHLERAWWGMESMIATPVGCLVVAEKGGEAIGDDVGYGPAHLHAPAELGRIVVELDAVSREAAEPRFRRQEEEERATRRAQGMEPPVPLTNDEFDAWSWKPFCALRTFVGETARANAWLLKWYD